MKNNQTLALLKKLKELFELYEDLYTRSVNQITPEFPVRNGSMLQEIEMQIASYLTNLAPIIIRYSSFAKKKYLYGDNPDIYRESIGHNDYKRKIGFINKSLQDLDSMVGLIGEEISFEQKNLANKTIAPKKFVQSILEKNIFPRKQKKLINRLSLAPAFRKETKILAREIETSDIHSLKKDTLATINKHGLSDVLKIEPFRDNSRSFYKLEVYPDELKSHY